MALELLAGPFPILDKDGESLSITTGQYNPKAFYDDEIGVLAFSSGDYTVTQLDGKAYRRSDGSGGNSGGALVLDLTDQGKRLMFLSPLFFDSLFDFNKKSGTLKDIVIDAETSDLIDLQAKCMDRYLSVQNNTVKAQPLDLSTAFMTECTLVGYGSGRANLSRTREADIICLIWPSGHVLYYDYVNKVQAPGSAFIAVNYGAWYSAKYDIFVMLTPQDPTQIKVYASSVLPTNISNPTAFPGLVKGKMSVISVTVSGANSDKCKNEMIEWSLEGPGELVTTQSLTNELGIASVKYIAPLDLSTDPIITATLYF